MFWFTSSDWANADASIAAERLRRGPGFFAMSMKDRPYKTKECQRSPNHPFALKGAVDSMESASGAAKAGRRAYEAEIEVERLNLWTPVVTGGDR